MVTRDSDFPVAVLGPAAYLPARFKFTFLQPCLSFSAVTEELSSSPSL